MDCEAESPISNDDMPVLDLPPLTDSERKHLFTVLQRAEEVQRQDEWRKVKLRTTSSITLASQNMTNPAERQKTAGQCSACGSSLLWIINPSRSCDRCQQSTCKSCTRLFDSGYRQLCSFCALDLKYRLESGEWFITKRKKADRTRKFAIEELRDALSLTPKRKDNRIHDGNLRSHNSPIPTIRSDRGQDSPIQQSPVPSIVISDVGKDSPDNGRGMRHKVNRNLHRKLLDKDRYDSSRSSEYSDDSSYLGSNYSRFHCNCENLKQSNEESSAYSCTSSDDDGFEATTVVQVDIPEDEIKKQPLATLYEAENESLTYVEEPRRRPSRRRPPASQESLVSLYSLADENFVLPADMASGDVQLSLEYDMRKGNLLVTVRQCRHLLPYAKTKRHSDPYVKLYLLPDKTRLAKRKTSTKKTTLNPVFNETFKYRVESSEIHGRSLWVTVWHCIRLGHNVFLGEANIPLSDVDLTDPAAQWFSLHEKREISLASPHFIYKGDLNVAVKHVPTHDILIVNERQVDSRGELHVWIKDAKNLIATHSNGYSNPFAKVLLLPDKSKKGKRKTDVIQKTLCPSWNIVLRFQNVSASDLEERSLEITVWDYSRLRGNEFLGGVRLNLGTGQHNGVEAKWMTASGYELTLWRSVIQRSNTWVEGCLSLRANMD